MTTKKIIFAGVICLSLLLVRQASAARLVPKNSPLQPIPQNTAPNTSSNINTPNSSINTNLQSQVPEKNNPTPPPTNTNTDTQPSATDQNAPIEGNIPTTSAAFYWFLLIVGLAGLVAAGIWSYLRFVYKSK